MSGEGEAQQRAAEDEIAMHIAALDALETILFGDNGRRSRDEMEAHAAALVERVEAQQEQMKALVDEERRMSTAYGEARNELAASDQAWQRAEEELRIREESQIPVIPAAAHKRLVAAEARVAELEEALEKARVTFLDFKVALYPLRHPLLAEAAAIAESYCSAALAAGVPVAPKEET